ncbi:MAG: hypothetical protein NW241_11415 [Bacteroidia bacterium]|nr:hypothetical protein [Bacteroidia bacterium]
MSQIYYRNDAVQDGFPAGAVCRMCRALKAAGFAWVSAWLMIACSAPARNEPDRSAGVPRAADAVSARVAAVVVPEHERRLAGVLGIVSFEGADTPFKLLNEDGSIWRKLKYTDQRSRDSVEMFGFHPDYYIMQFKCTGKYKNRYRILVHERLGIEKWISRGADVAFQSWEQYLLEQVFALDPDMKSNPPRAAPDDHASEMLPNIEYPVFRPVAVSGDWVSVEWDDQDEVKHVGWFRWRRDDQLIVYIYSFA